MDIAGMRSGILELRVGYHGTDQTAAPHRALAGRLGPDRAPG